MKERRNSKWMADILAVVLLCSGCGGWNGAKEPVSVAEEPVIEKNAQESGVTSNVADDTWYKSGSIYVDEDGRRMEVFYDDEGMLQFAVDGLSLYNTMSDDYQQENDWRIYTCDDGTTVIYYPGAPAHLEISDGEYAGVYEEDDGR